MGRVRTGPPRAILRTDRRRPQATGSGKGKLGPADRRHRPGTGGSLNWRDLRLRLRAAIFPARVERELEEELGAHIELQERKLRQSGLSAEEARRQARLQFGRVGAVQESCRDERRIGLLETARQDVRYAARGIRRSPGFALAVIATIGLGLGI